MPATKEGEGEKEGDRQTDRLSAIREGERDRSAVCHQIGSGRGRERQIGYLPIGEARSVVCPQRGRERRSNYLPMREADRLSAIRERRRGKERQIGYLPVREARSVVCHHRGRERDRSVVCHQRGRGRERQIGCLAIAFMFGVDTPARS